MLQLITRKWWVVLIQGILLLILSFLIFRNPSATLATVSMWMSLLILLAGIVGLVSSFSGDHHENRVLLIVWSVFTIIFGILLLGNMLVTMKTVTILFGLWMLIGGVRLLVTGWEIKKTESAGWFMLIIGVLSIIAGFMTVTNIGTGALGISILIGTQVLIAGLALIMLAFAKKKVKADILERVGTHKRF